MSETSKPSWVKALDEAEDALRRAAGHSYDPNMMDAETRLAYAWMAASDRYRAPQA